jgi:hypothetical protein
LSVGHFYVLLGLGAFVLLLFLWSLARRLGRRHRLPYVLEPSLFSPAQQAFLPVLERAMGRGYRVYGNVRVADVLGVRRRLDRRVRRRALDRLGQYRFDFLVCTAESATIVCAVNLSPRSRLGRRPPRNRLDRICDAAGLPFVRFREADRYSVVEVEEQVFGAMQTVRLGAKEAEPPREETDEALGNLSAAITGNRAGSPAGVKARQWIRAVRAKGGRAAAAARPDAGSPSAGSDRTDPVLAPVVSDDSQVDDGPRFQIEGDLELEERPIRFGKR